MYSENFAFIVKTSTLYGILAAVFSLVGLFLSSAYLTGNPLEVSGISVEHVIGHIVLGLMIGLVTFKLKYFLIGGIFSIILDADHLIQFLGIEVVPRMAHSISFGLIAIFVMMIIFGKRDYLLGAISFAAVLSHISYDILLNGTSEFPFFTPFTSEVTIFQGYDWILMEIVAVMLVGISVLISKRKKMKNEFKLQ
jgi:hypothetical protein